MSVVGSLPFVQPVVCLFCFSFLQPREVKISAVASVGPSSPQRTFRGHQCQLGRTRPRVFLRRDYRAMGLAG